MPETNADITITLDVKDDGTAVLKQVEGAVDSFAKKAAQAGAAGVKALTDQLGNLNKSQQSLGQQTINLSNQESRRQAVFSKSEWTLTALNTGITTTTKSLDKMGESLKKSLPEETVATLNKTQAAFTNMGEGVGKTGKKGEAYLKDITKAVSDLKKQMEELDRVSKAHSGNATIANKLEEEKRKLLIKAEELQRKVNTGFEQGKLNVVKYSDATSTLSSMVASKTVPGMTTLGNKAFAMGTAFISSTIGIGLTSAGLGALIIKSAETYERIRGLTSIVTSLGQAEGFTREQTLAGVSAIQQSTLSRKAALEIMVKFLEAQISISSAIELTRLAQQYALRTGQSTSELVESLAIAIEFQSKHMFRRLGLLIETEAAERKLANTLGVSVSQLTESEKRGAIVATVQETLKNRLGETTEAITSNVRRWEALSKTVQSFALIVGPITLPLLKNTANLLLVTVGGLKNITEAYVTFSAVLIATYNPITAAKIAMDQLVDADEKLAAVVEGRLTKQQEEVKLAKELLTFDISVIEAKKKGIPVSEAQIKAIIERNKQSVQGIVSTKALKQALEELDLETKKTTKSEQDLYLEKKRTAENALHLDQLVVESRGKVLQAEKNSLAGSLAISRAKEQLEIRAAELSEDPWRKSRAAIGAIQAAGNAERLRMMKDLNNELEKMTLESQKHIARIMAGGDTPADKLQFLKRESELELRVLKERFDTKKVLLRLAQQEEQRGHKQQGVLLRSIAEAVQTEITNTERKLVLERNRILLDAREQFSRDSLRLEKEISEARPGGVSRSERIDFLIRENEQERDELEKRLGSVKHYEELIRLAEEKGETETAASLRTIREDVNTQWGLITQKGAANILKIHRETNEKTKALQMRAAEEQLILTKLHGDAEARVVAENAIKLLEIQRKILDLTKQRGGAEEEQKAAIDQTIAALKELAIANKQALPIEIAKEYGNNIPVLKRFLDSIDSNVVSAEAYGRVLDAQAENIARARAGQEELNRQWAEGTISVDEYAKGMAELNEQLQQSPGHLNDISSAVLKLTGSIRAAQEISKGFKNVQEGMKGATEAFFGALMKGDNAGRAFKRFLADTLAAEGKAAAVKGIIQMAEGFAALIWNPPKAAQHFTSAAYYFAGAALAGAAAGAMGAGGAAGGGSSGASTGTSQTGKSSPDIYNMTPGPFTTPPGGPSSGMKALEEAAQLFRASAKDLSEAIKVSSVVTSKSIDNLNKTIDKIDSKPPGVLVIEGLKEESTRSRAGYELSTGDASDRISSRERAKAALGIT